MEAAPKKELTPNEKEQKQPFNFDETFEESRKLMEGTKQSTTSLKETAGETSEAGKKSDTMDNNPLFASLKEWTVSFPKELYKKLAFIKEDQMPNFMQQLQQQLTLNDCLKKLLKGVSMTTDKELQAKYLQKVHGWFDQEKKSTESVFSIDQKSESGPKLQKNPEEEKAENVQRRTGSKDIESKASRESKNPEVKKKLAVKEDSPKTESKSPPKPQLKKPEIPRQLHEVTGFRVIQKSGRAEWNHTHFIFAFDCSGI
jgi:hypothetical protein